MTKFLGQSIRTAALIAVLSLAATAARAGEIKGTVNVAGASSAKNVAVWIGAIAGKTFTPPAKHAVIDQHHMEFIPHVAVILKGTTVEFLNSDATLHNVYWPWISGNKKLAKNLGTRPLGQKLAFTFDNLGIIPLLCNVHTEMYGYIVVVSTPYFEVTGPEGSFDIKDVPPGHYTLKAWSEKLSFRKVKSQPVQVAAGVTTVNLHLGR
jgi:plastocyanin